ncbi:hypothetical protein OEA41_008947 [Lepraria neglecta]|uniref:Uncharacterized protein n=1 Tax=Lepraria neglecta TaxID=209136 RepID=A0AAD9Z2T3_9LECA|nr:hypothetical protein OEA41_008947 [Lepraria neglecta]
MPSQAETPHKPTRRSRRPRKSTGPLNSHIPSSQEAELSSGTSPDKQPDQPMPTLRRGEKEITPDPAPAVNLQLPPHTPPRPRSMYEGSTIKQYAGNDSAPELSQNKKRTPKPQSRKQSGSVSPMPAADGIPISAPRPQSMTPNRTNETPVRAYAGPTFHTSPAASSLPMPKFFSRSVPNVDKTSNLKTMMEQEAPDTTSGSEESPSQENSQPAHDHRAREESPLDIFFRADREAKSKAHPTKESGTESPNDQARLSASPSGSQTPTGYHSRHPTDSSIGGMFPLEMDGPAPELSSGPTPPNAIHDVHTNRPVISSSSSMTEADRKEERRKAQTQALKEMLFSPRPQLPHNGSAGQRPPSSGLRKELTMPASPGRPSGPELPATPTPSRVHNPYTSANSRPQNQQNGYVSPYSSFTPPRIPSHGSNITPVRNNGNAKSMEDDLRRILKLDVLGGEGVSPIRS